LALAICHVLQVSRRPKTGSACSCERFPALLIFVLVRIFIFHAPNLPAGMFRSAFDPRLRLAGALTEHFIDAGVRVPDERTLPDRQPRGPAELGEIATRWGIEFWTGPVEPAS
jgi:hypothetical protein